MDLDLNSVQATVNLASDMVVDDLIDEGDDFDDDALVAQLAALGQTPAPRSGAEAAVPAATTVAATVQPTPPVLKPDEVHGQGFDQAAVKEIERLKAQVSSMAAVSARQQTQLLNLTAINVQQQEALASLAGTTAEVESSESDAS